MVNTNVYKEHGYDTRTEYLEGLADDYDADIDTVIALADALGPDEDFDGLVTTLEDEYGIY